MGKPAPTPNALNKREQKAEADKKAEFKKNQKQEKRDTLKSVTGNLLTLHSYMFHVFCFTSIKMIFNTDISHKSFLPVIRASPNPHPPQTLSSLFYQPAYPFLYTCVSSMKPKSRNYNSEPFTTVPDFFFNLSQLNLTDLCTHIRTYPYTCTYTPLYTN